MLTGLPFAERRQRSLRYSLCGVESHSQCIEFVAQQPSGGERTTTMRPQCRRLQVFRPEVCHNRFDRSSMSKSGSREFSGRSSEHHRRHQRPRRRYRRPGLQRRRLLRCSSEPEVIHPKTLVTEKRHQDLHLLKRWEWTVVSLTYLHPPKYVSTCAPSILPSTGPLITSFALRSAVS